MLINEVVVVSPYQQNCRILSGDGHHALICDPGDEAERILATCRELSLVPVAILLTHAHLDHCAAAAELSRLAQIKIIGPGAGDDFLLQNLQAQAAMLSLPVTEALHPQYVSDGELIEYAGLRLQVISTPGHTPGGVSYYCQSENFVLCGDTLFYGSVGRTDFPGGNTEQLLHSLTARLYALPAQCRALCGHGPDTTIGFEKSNNPYTLSWS
ncbi:MAG: MBL fold metallo-hydrolase [Succinivibrio sp.]|nr:MBL fold metallo-hydrolase [Succinivibrio sp.]